MAARPPSCLSSSLKGPNIPTVTCLSQIAIELATQSIDKHLAIANRAQKEQSCIAAAHCSSVCPGTAFVGPQSVTRTGFVSSRQTDRCCSGLDGLYEAIAEEAMVTARSRGRKPGSIGAC